MTRAEVAAQSLIDAGYVDPAKYEELASAMAFFFGDVACEAREYEREACAKVVDGWRAFKASSDMATAIRARSTK
jgi:hypothetical protein